MAQFIPRIYRQGGRFYDAESGDCWGPCGLGYYVTSRVLWDVKEAGNVDAIVDDFLAKAFGSAKEEMREFYRLIAGDTQRRSPSDLLGRMYRQLDAAAHATQDQKVRARLDDLILYTRYAEMYYAHANAGTPVAEVARFAYRIRRTMMVHSYGLWCRLLSQRDALDPGHPLKGDQPFTRDELATFLSEGIAHNQPQEPGFTGIEFSHNLVPAAIRLGLPNVPDGQFPTNPQDHQHYVLWIPRQGTLSLKVTVQKVWALRKPKITLYSPLEVSLNAVAESDGYSPDGKTYDVNLKTTHAGLHRLETIDGGDYTRIEWPASMPVSIESGIDTAEVTSHFRGPWTMYFYVPRGTVGRRLGVAGRQLGAAGSPGNCWMPTGREMIDFAKSGDGWFKAPVPPGQDGRLWKFQDSLGQRLLMTVPPYLAAR